MTCDHMALDLCRLNSSHLKKTGTPGYRPSLLLQSIDCKSFLNRCFYLTIMEWWQNQQNNQILKSQSTFSIHMPPVSQMRLRNSRGVKQGGCAGAWKRLTFLETFRFITSAFRAELPYFFKPRWIFLLQTLHVARYNWLLSKSLKDERFSIIMHLLGLHKGPEQRQIPKSPGRLIIQSNQIHFASFVI